MTNTFSEDIIDIAKAAGETTAVQGCETKIIREGVGVGRLNLYFGGPLGTFDPVRILKQPP